MKNNQQLEDIKDSILENVNTNEQINDLAGRINKNIPKWVYWVWIISIIAFGLSIAALFIRVSYNWNVELVSTTIILTFIGIIATFIVISNYQQTKDIQRDFDNKVYFLQNQMKLMEKKFKFINAYMEAEFEKMSNEIPEKLDKDIINKLRAKGIV